MLFAEFFGYGSSFFVKENNPGKLGKNGGYEPIEKAKKSQEKLPYPAAKQTLKKKRKQPNLVAFRLVNDKKTTAKQSKNKRYKNHISITLIKKLHVE